MTPYCEALLRRRLMMMNSTIRKRTPATTRIIVPVSIFPPYPFRPRLPGKPLAAAAYRFRSGNSSRMIAMIPGPRITTINAGKIKNTSGGTIFTVVLAACSSARCRRFTYARIREVCNG